MGNVIMVNDKITVHDPVRLKQSMFSDLFLRLLLIWLSLISSVE